MRADVEAIRGVQCGELLRHLMEKGLVRIAGRDDSLGRPMLYGTTKKFLQMFGLNSLKDLPEIEQLRPPAKLEPDM
jgi:segregation and condensation protein B